jgi:hypothetical protein
MLVRNYDTIWCYNPEEHNINTQRRKYLKSYKHPVIDYQK